MISQGESQSTTRNEVIASNNSNINSIKINSSLRKEQQQQQQQISPNFPRYAILVIDMLNDFVKGKLKCERASRIIPNIQVLLDNARRKDIPVFYCIDEHLPLDTYEMNLWGPHAMKGTEGQRIIDELRPSDRDYVIPKRTYSAFDGTELDRALKAVYDGKGANTIIITGLDTNICARHTSYDAFTRGLRIIVVEDGVDAFTEEEHMSGLEYMKRVYGAEVKRTSDVVNSL
jgi:nicotinamidase-related amidase